MGGKLLLIVESQLINEDGMMKLENYYLTTIIIITDLGKDHQ